MSDSIKTILLVDDEQDIIDSISVRLQASGYQIIAARDGLEALKKARSLRPDLIILDLMLPKMDGYKVARLLKFDKRYSDIPILILSARGQEIDKELARSAGADDYLVKPFDSAELLTRIKEL